MRRASLPARLDRLAERGHPADLERTIAELAAETGLDPAEIRAEWDQIVARTRRFGPEPAEHVVCRCARELGLPEAELWSEATRIAGSVGSTR